MADTIIEPLLQLPILNFAAAAKSSTKTATTTDFTTLIKTRSEYEQRIKDFVNDEKNKSTFTLEVTEACVDLLLRYFNTANFVGDITIIRKGAKDITNNDTMSKEAIELKQKREDRIQKQSSAAVAAKLEALAARVFDHFHCSDEEEMPPSAFTTSSKTGVAVKREDDAEEGASRVLAPEPYRLLLRSLYQDGEAMETAVRRGALLAAALALAHTLPATSIWRVRAFYRHQLCLMHRSNTLHKILVDAIETISKGDIPKSQAPLYAIEFSEIYQFYHRPEGAQRFIDMALLTSGLKMEEKAFHGIRTRHMQEERPQLIMSATSVEDAEHINMLKSWEQPTEIQGERSGHDILDRPRKLGSDEQLDNAKPLLTRDYAIILALCSHLKSSNAESGLNTHQARVYIERLMIEKEGCFPWVFKAMALLLRARFEYGKNRVQERAFLQYQELIDGVVPEGSARLVRAAFYGEDAGNNAGEGQYFRMERCDPNSGCFYAVPWPSNWSLRREYGDRCFEDNLFKTALELFELTLDWPNIIKCCKELDRRNKAASLAEELLKEDANDVMLWVALGEARRDEAPLLHAWELCKGQMAAPMRALARLALSRERYEDVMKYFDQSVKINPVFGGDWFSLGYAAMRLQNQDTAGAAFTRVCQINPEDSYGWLNLAAILLRQGKPRPAFNATSQALRNNSHDWRMWDNYFKIGVQIKEVTESAHALRRLTTIATNQWQPVAETVLNFVRIALQFIRGELEGTENETEDDLAAAAAVEDGKTKASAAAEAASLDDKIARQLQREQAKNVTVNLESVEGAEKLRVPAFAVGAAVEGEEGESDAMAAANAGLKPLFEELDEIEQTVYKDPIEKKIELDRQIRDRFEKRTRELLLTIGGTYTSHSCIHAALAEFFGSLDGPRYGFVWREKQVRETLQQPLWERTRERLQIVIDAAKEMTDCAIAAEKEMKEKKQQAEAKESSNDDQKVKEEKAEIVTGFAVNPKRDAMQQINHIIEKATPHFQDDEELMRPLRVCVVKLKKA